MTNCDSISIFYENILKAIPKNIIKAYLKVGSDCN